jgi:hypothetical protein
MSLYDQEDHVAGAVYQLRTFFADHLSGQPISA